MNEQQGFPNVNAPFVKSKDDLTIAQIWMQLLITLWNRTGAAQGSTSVPAGVMNDYAGGGLPAGWLLADGAAIGRSQYQNLFNAIGTTWGAGDGSSTFNLPDFRGRFLLGASASHILGTTGGSETHAQTVNELAAHNHDVTDPGHAHAIVDSGHDHNVTDPTHLHTVTDLGHNHTQDPHSHTQQVFNNNLAGSSGSQGSDTANATSVGVTNNSTATNQANTTGVTVNLAATGLTVNSDVTGVTVADHVTDISIDNKGNGQAFSIMPPFAVVTRIIKY